MPALTPAERIAAADAALQRIARAREAGKPDARSEIDILLADLEVGAVDVSTVDRSRFLELVTKLGETDAKAADAALQRFARAREAREDEAFDAKYPSDIDGLALGDLEIGADETSEVIEDIGELDSGARDAAENTTVKAEAHEAPREPTKLLEQIRAARIKYSGGVDISSDDPLANEKRRVANLLKKVGRTLADLPRDWDTLSRTARDGERSRQSELYRVLEAGREEMREAERLHELEKCGLPANYDLLPRDEKDRINVNLRQRRHRGKMPKPSAKSIIALPMADVGPESLRGTLIKMSRSLENWALYRDTPRARQLRKPEQQKVLLRAAAIYARHFNSHGKPPSHGDLAKGLRCSGDQARRRLDLLKRLYEPGGPWASA